MTRAALLCARTALVVSAVTGDLPTAVIVGGMDTEMSTPIQIWNTPINAKGRIAVGVNGQLYVFTP